MLDLIIHATMKMLQICESKVQMIHLTPCTEICIHVHSDTPYTEICTHSNDREVGGGGAEHATLFLVINTVWLIAMCTSKCNYHCTVTCQRKLQQEILYTFNVKLIYNGYLYVHGNYHVYLHTDSPLYSYTSRYFCTNRFMYIEYHCE